MKLRQKLAMVLAAAMIVTAVPVTTMAASTNKLTKEVSLVEGTNITTDAGVGVEIVVDKVSEKGRTFYVNAQDFAFDKEAYQNAEFTTWFEDANVEVVYLKENQLQVTIKEDLAGQESKKLYVPIMGTAKKGTPTIVVDGKDSDVTTGTYVLSGEVVTAENLLVTAGTAKNISIDGEGQIADVIISEKEVGALSGQSITLTLPNRSDLEFVDGKAGVTLEGERGLHTLNADFIKSIEYVTAKDKTDQKQIVITFNELPAGITTTGSVTIKGINVQPEDPRQECKTGEVKVKVSGEEIETTSILVANVTDFGVAIDVVDEEAAQLVAGREQDTVKVKFYEQAVNSFDARKDVYFTVAGADVDLEEGVVVYDKDDAVITYEGENEFALDFKTLKEDAPNEIEFEIPLMAKVGAEGEVTLTATSKAFQKDVVQVIGEVTPILTHATKEAVLKVGLNGQKAGEIVISEVEAGTFEKGQEIKVTLPEEVTKDGISLKGAALEVVEGDIELEDVKVDGNDMIITVKRSSDEASVIKVKDIEFNVNRMTPEGKYDVEISGDAICEFEGKIKVEDFVVIGTKNVEDENGLTSGTASFKVGDKKFTHNGEEKDMDVAAYISGKDRIMIPVRFLSEAFGIAKDKILFDQPTGTVTMFIGEKVVQLVNGQNMALINGVKVPMEEAMTIKDDRSFVPMGELARILNVQVAWDNETKTATFTN